MNGGGASPPESLRYPLAAPAAYSIVPCRPDDLRMVVWV
jgi:hypothetical protein